MGKVRKSLGGSFQQVGWRGRWLMPLVMLTASLGFSGVTQAAVIALTASPATSSTFGQSVTFTATVTSTASGFNTVSFTDGGTPIAGCGAAAPTGGGLITRPATCTTSALTASGSTRVIRATQSGAVAVPDIIYPTTVFGAYNAINYSVNQADTTTTITSDNPDPSVVGEAVTVNYTVAVTAPGAGTPTGNVTVAVTGPVNSNSCSAAVGAGTCTLPGTDFPQPGSYTLTATYEGDTNFNTSLDTEPHQVNAVGPVGGAAPIPTLQEWALMLFGLLLGGLVWRQSQRKGRMEA